MHANARGLVDRHRAAQQPTLIIENGRVVGGDGTVLNRGSVVISQDRILSVTDQPVASSGVRRIDTHGRTILPGLIDTHLHLTIGAAVADSTSLAAFLQQNVPQFLREFLHHGVTTVRSTGEYWPGVKLIRERIENGELMGPRLLTAGAVVTLRGARPVASGCRGNAFCGGGIAVEVDNADQARAAVQRLAREGVDFVKLVSESEIVPVQMPDEVMAATIAEAHRQGLKAVGHITHQLGRNVGCIQLLQ